MTSDLYSTIKSHLKISDQDFEKIVEKAVAGGETNIDKIADWLVNRFLPNCVIISKTEYSRMCVNALKIVSHVAPTDYGSSRQRDLGQLWADMIRGYLGEAAFRLFLEKNWPIKVDLGHEKGSLREYLPMDIHKVTLANEAPRPPKLKISVKATKWNGIWLDIPGGQFNHSDIHVLVKVGVGRDHLFAFFKEISVFRDKILKIGKELGSLSEEESDTLFSSLPSFNPIPAYICGFAKKSERYDELSYSGKKGRIHFTINSWNGPVHSGDLNRIKSCENLPAKGKVQFEGIGTFSHDQGYLFNTGSLIWKKEDWDKVINLL